MYKFHCKHCKKEVYSKSANAKFCTASVCQRARKNLARQVREAAGGAKKNIKNATVEQPVLEMLLEANNKIKRQSAVVEEMQQRVDKLSKYVVELKRRLDAQQFSYRYDLEVGDR